MNTKRWHCTCNLFGVDCNLTLDIKMHVNFLCINLVSLLYEKRFNANTVRNSFLIFIFPSWTMTVQRQVIDYMTSNIYKFSGKSNPISKKFQLVDLLVKLASAKVQHIKGYSCNSIINRHLYISHCSCVLSSSLSWHIDMLTTSHLFDIIGNMANKMTNKLQILWLTQLY